uniref:Follicle-stimulating hormone beta subunit n=1 Tax=Anoplopoma fimbria TaxID=229290 RepID=S5UH36_ANOFI|nr:follicle-stimulating hormone beta subunit [Anoplopoma fimbria]
MQLVVMAAVLGMVAAGQDCCFSCRLTNCRIPVESCGRTVFIDTTICEGQCFNRDPVYTSPQHRHEYDTCNGDWSYEVKHIDGCPDGVTYPVARNCKCNVCNPNESTDCEGFPGDVSSCLSF